jgi:hypothetical protein
MIRIAMHVSGAGDIPADKDNPEVREHQARARRCSEGTPGADALESLASRRKDGWRGPESGPYRTMQRERVTGINAGRLIQAGAEDGIDGEVPHWRLLSFLLVLDCGVRAPFVGRQVGGRGTEGRDGVRA